MHRRSRELVDCVAYGSLDVAVKRLVERHLFQQPHHILAWYESTRRTTDRHQIRDRPAIDCNPKPFASLHFSQHTSNIVPQCTLWNSPHIIV